MAKRGVRLHAFVGSLVCEWVLAGIYVIGLTLLFPFLYFLAIPGNTSPKILTIAAVLVLVSFFGFMYQKGTLASALHKLSKITLVPGLIGVFFSFFGSTTVLGLIGTTAPAEAIALLELYIDQAVPKIQVLTIVYILLGLFLWFIASKLDKRPVRL